MTVGQTSQRQFIVATNPADLIDGGGGSTLGRVWPPKPPMPLPDKDSRDYALERLRAFITALVFQRTNAKNLPPIPFQLPKSNVQIQQPDDIKTLKPPAISITPGRGFHEAYGLGPPSIIEETVGIFGEGTALVRVADYIEPIVIETWGTKKAERRALMAGLKTALRSDDGSYSIRLKMPDYFGLVADFSLNESQYIDGDEVSRNRRRGQLMVTMSVCEAFLVNTTPFRSSLAYTVLDGNLGSGLDC